VSRTGVPDACNYGIDSFPAVYFFVDGLIKSPQNLTFVHLFFCGKRNRHSLSLSPVHQLLIQWHVLITKTNQGIPNFIPPPHSTMHQCLLLLGSLTLFLNFASRIVFRAELIQVLDLFPTSNEKMGKYLSYLWAG
jgi:hypothetical protein